MESNRYSEWLQGLSKRYRTSQVKAAVAVNTEMLQFYWSLGADIVRMEPDQPWGSKFMQHLSDDLRREIPDGGCFSRINLYYMKWFYELYCTRLIVPQAGEQLADKVCERLEIVPQVGEQSSVEAYQNRFPRVSQLLLSVPWGHHIEGDNLEVLKLLQTSYAGKVKMIYIDPPYNTGHDFVYRDRFSLTDKELAEQGGAWVGKCKNFLKIFQHGGGEI